MRTCTRRTAEDIIEIGRDLNRMKERLPHGSFLPWIEAEFGMSEWAARRFMNVHSVYGKSGSVPDLPPTALYELAAPKTPIEVREEVEKMIEATNTTQRRSAARFRLGARKVFLMGILPLPFPTSGSPRKRCIRHANFAMPR